MFICVVVNIFVSIIEEAFVNSKVKNKKHWIYSFVKKEQKKDETSKTKTEMKMYAEVRRKNIIIDSLTDNEKDKIIETENVEKRDTIKDIGYFSKILLEAKKEINNVSKEIKECKESKMKYELNLFLLQRIDILKKMLLNIEKLLE